MASKSYDSDSTTRTASTLATDDMTFMGYDAPASDEEPLDVLYSEIEDAISTAIMAAITMTGPFAFKSVTIPADDTTPDVSGGNIFVTSANTGATEITDLDNPVVGQLVLLVGGSDTNSSTIADSSPFALSAAWTASADDTLLLYVRADNDYVEITRSTN